jgi:hypothetical protein
MIWAVNVVSIGGLRYAFKMLGDPEGKRQLGRRRRRWEDNIKRDFKEIGCEGVNWINLAQDRDQWRAVMATVVNFRVLLKAANFMITDRSDWSV